MQATFSSTHEKLLEYIKMYEELKELYDKDPALSNWGNAANGYVYDMVDLAGLIRSGIEFKDITYKFSNPNCFNMLQLAYHKYVKGEKN